MTPVKDIAKVVIQKSSGPISNLKLQKLLYYVQGWSLGLRDEPAFESRIEAWVHGPVVPEIFHAYRHYRWNTIDVPSESIRVHDADAAHIENVLSAYGHLSASQLEALSHDESPWIEARAGLSPRDLSNVVITHDAMKTFFKSQSNV